MALLFPTAAVPKAYDITADSLRALDIKGLILDIDNTLTTHDHPLPDGRILQWLDQMRAEGIRLILLSNNHSPRVAPFAKKLGLAFEADAKKPLPGGYRRAALAMGLAPRQTAVVGDQILVEPFQMEPFFRFRFKRFLERGILKRYRAKQRRQSF